MSEILDRIEALEKRVAAAEAELQRLHGLEDEESFVARIIDGILQAIEEPR